MPLSISHRADLSQPPFPLPCVSPQRSGHQHRVVSAESEPGDTLPRVVHLQFTQLSQAWRRRFISCEQHLDSITGGCYTSRGSRMSSLSPSAAPWLPLQLSPRAAKTQPSFMPSACAPGQGLLMKSERGASNDPVDLMWFLDTGSLCQQESEVFPTA